MVNSKFKINLSKTTNFYSNGMDLIDFEFLANKDEFKKIKDAASVGEMSRIMCLLNQLWLSTNSYHPLFLMKLIQEFQGNFKKNGIIMKELGTKIQTFSITHLPQIAAMGSYTS